MSIITDNCFGTNIACICGEVIEEISKSHTTYGETFYTFLLGIYRNSGYEDEIIIIASEKLLCGLDIRKGSYVKIQGQIRTYNENSDGRNKLHINVFAREIGLVAEENYICQNDIYLEGYLCKSPNERTSPLGRKICDLMLAVNRMYNKSDYVPCIAWGRNAAFAGKLSVGTKVSLKGRLQSREYKKKIDDDTYETKIAYEVSVMQLETIDEHMI